MMASLTGIALIVLLAIGIAGTVIAVRRSSGQASSTGTPTARRVVVYVLLFALVVIAAIGLSGLLGRLIDAGTLPSGSSLAGSDVSGLARSLAFSLVAGPFAVVLWWGLWRRLAGVERASLAWGLYLAGMQTVALITATSALLTTVAALVRSDWQPRTFAIALVWALVWAWHRWMARHQLKSPTQLASVAPLLTSTFGLLIGAVGAVTALASLIDAAVDVTLGSITVGEPWWHLPLQSAIWLLGGALIWWWQWMVEQAQRMSGVLADLVLIVVGIAAAAAATLGGTGTVIFVLLRLAFARENNSLTDILGALGTASATALVGAVVWAYHHGLIRQRTPLVSLAATLVVSGLGLVAAATGLGIVVNSLLAGLTPVLIGSDPRSLLLGGLSAAVVGGPLWWAVWKPLRAVDPVSAGVTGRRIYLILIFGISAVVAIITLLVIGYRVFEFALDDLSRESLLDRVRAPLGLLVATGLAAGYHFSVWKRDRAASSTLEPPAQTIDRVILVTPGDSRVLRAAIADLTGAAVTVWLRAPTAGAQGDFAADSVPSAERIAAALAGVTGARVLVVLGADERIEVIPLQE
ncbi:DUF5671 domain-containing protein [Cryobacterium sp. PH29-G1]|uniref:DUF5671 domain-containing protein n=1 Tax=Cryobacterium sp. PH29-G1 TaxID=3046211 RepID=UPI0024BACD0C|nr:DUF5671 domain-containing protein [Cryobacterium sp. PH29-G1]MDJ0349867.1 DUF5671 domain-containing protein [Cryobacterium sp. PH29-G1]